MGELSLAKKSGSSGTKEPELIGSFSSTTTGYHVMQLPCAISEYSQFVVTYHFNGSTTGGAHSSSVGGLLLYGEKSSATGDYFGMISAYVLEGSTTDVTHSSYLLPCVPVGTRNKGISFFDESDTTDNGIIDVTEAGLKSITIYFARDPTYVNCTLFDCSVYGIRK